jgi:hypothetical protein
MPTIPPKLASGSPAPSPRAQSGAQRQRMQRPYTAADRHPPAAARWDELLLTLLVTAALIDRCWKRRRGGAR